MERRIVADSAINRFKVDNAALATVPMKIIAGNRTYVDDERLDVRQMVKDLSAFKGRSSTACPSPEEWTEAFADADEVFCITISSSLSGSHNAAQVAAREYMENHPDRRVLVIDSLSAGGEMGLLAECLGNMIAKGMTFDEIAAALPDVQANHQLVFCLQSVRSLANNGRINPAIAALIGILGMRLVGRASDHGELEMMSKCRGDKKALTGILSAIDTLGYKGGRMHIDHCSNPTLANAVASALKARYPSAPITIGDNTGLCSYYAEEGGMIIGFNTEPL